MPTVRRSARGQENEGVLGRKLGADDYVKKPFGVAELMARIEAALRRSRAADPSLGPVEFGGDALLFDLRDAGERNERVRPAHSTADVKVAKVGGISDSHCLCRKEDRHRLIADIQVDQIVSTYHCP